jgi:serine phosphatase RsbU (regulator of sigma subunit)
MLGISLLNEIVLAKGIVRPDEILNALRLKIIDALKQEKDSIIKDGMDMTVCLLDPQKNKLLFSGANNPLYHIHNGELNQIKGNKMPVAIHEVMQPFTLHELDLVQGDTFYTFSDGFADQFGGPLQKKFLAKNFRNLLASIQDLPMIEQGVRLDETFEAYRENVEQVDDVVIIGVRY